MLFLCDLMEMVHHLFISCPFVRIIWCMIYFTYNIPSSANITNMFDNWLNGIDILKLEFALAFLLCVGQYGIAKTILSLTNKMVLIFCRLSEWLRIGFIYGPTSFRRIKRNLWILDTTSWWLLETSTRWRHINRITDGCFSFFVG
jgi:hypothetical protein